MNRSPGESSHRALRWSSPSVTGRSSRPAPTTDPTLELILNTQAHHIARLEASDAADPVIQSRQRIYDEVEDPVLANAAYLEDLIEVVAPPPRGTLDQINIALRRHYLQRIRGDRALGLGTSALTTTNSGSAYREECINNDVPVPETVLDDSDERWENHGVLAAPVLEGLLDAEVWSYVSDPAEGEPRGVCIALPRWNGQDEAEFLGLICLGQDSSKVCFFDNPNGEYFSRYQAIEIDDFKGGAELAGNGQGMCTDCHAGENPFVVHPEEKPFDEFKIRVENPWPLSWPEPIVSSTWIQNPPPINRPARLGGFLVGVFLLAGCVGETGPLEDGSIPDAGAEDAGWEGVVCGDGTSVDGVAQANLDALEGCEILRGNLHLTAPVLDRDPPISDLSPLASLRVVEGGIGCGHNPDLETLDGLERLEVVDGLSFQGCDGLRSLSALRSLRDLGRRDVSIESMEHLTDLRGFEGIRVVGRNLRIVSNPNLTSLDGLEALERVEGRLSIALNPRLPQSEIDELRSRVEVLRPVGGD